MFSDTYFIIALTGFVGCLLASNMWNHVYNNIGKGIMIVGVGLLLQALGHISYTIEFLQLGVANPFFSSGDIFFMLSYLFFIISFYYLFIGMGINLSQRTTNHLSESALLMSFVIFVLILSVLYFKLGIQNNFTYVLFIYSILSLTLLLMSMILLIHSRRILNNVFLKPYLLLVFGYCFFFVGDVLYSTETLSNTWVAGGFSDVLYMLAFSFLGLSFTTLGNLFYKPLPEPITIYLSYEALV